MGGIYSHARFKAVFAGNPRAISTPTMASPPEINSLGLRGEEVTRRNHPASIVSWESATPFLFGEGVKMRILSAPSATAAQNMLPNPSPPIH